MRRIIYGTLLVIFSCIFRIEINSQNVPFETTIFISYNVSFGEIRYFQDGLFWDGLEERLDNYDVDFQLISTDDEHWNNASAHIDLIYDYSSDSDLFSYDVDNPISHISPILYQQTIGLSTTFDEQTTSLTSAQLDFITAISLYSIEHCDFATPLLEHIIDDNSLELHFIRTSYTLLGNCAVLSGDYNAALNYYQSATSDSFDQMAPFSSLAWVQIQLNEPETAFSTMSDLLDYIANTHNLQEEEVIAWRTKTLTARAQLHALNFDYDSAIADMDAAIALDPENPELYVLRGQMVILLYEWNRVAENYNTALEIDPNYPPAYFYRGILYYTNLFREDALADFERYLEIAPHGEHAADAARYAESIRAEIAALND